MTWKSGVLAYSIQSYSLKEWDNDLNQSVAVVVLLQDKAQAQALVQMAAACG